VLKSLFDVFFTVLPTNILTLRIHYIILISESEYIKNYIPEKKRESVLVWVLLNFNPTKFGHVSKGRNNSRINNGLRSSLSRKRITVSLKYSA
jgi:hypothetical protein